MKVTLEDIKKAAENIKPYIHQTLLEHSASLSDLVGADVYLKFENLQQTGSFKIRGAANKVSSLTQQEKSVGVIAASAGNHAQGVALVAQKLGVKATIVMPEMSPLIKVASTKRFGAEVILKGSAYDDAYQTALELQKKHGSIFIHPFEDEKIIAGQGTIGLEIINACPEVDVVYIAIGGGGLLSGIAIALKALNSKIKIIGVQASGADSMARSFKSKKLVTNIQKVSTIADGIAVKQPSDVMYSQFISKLCDDVVTVNDDEIAKTIVLLMERAKTVVEGAGAVSVAALLSKKSNIKFKKAVAVLGGGNIDLNTLEKVIDRGLQEAGRLARILVSAPDVPGSLNRLTSIIAEKKANVLQINHNRVSDRIHLRETLIEFTLETTGPAHIVEIKKSFEAIGATILE